MGDLKTLTTSSRMSAWLLCGLPIFVSIVITVMNPEYMSVLWKDQRGHYLIAAAMFLQVTGMLIVRKMFEDKDLKPKALLRRALPAVSSGADQPAGDAGVQRSGSFSGVEN